MTPSFMPSRLRNASRCSLCPSRKLLHPQKCTVVQRSITCRRGAVQACLRPIEVSRELATARAVESQQPQPLLQDPFAPLLQGPSPASDAATSTTSSSSNRELDLARDIIATRYIDESIMNAMSATNVSTINQGGDYRQVVLLGDGMDTRPFRMVWPPGTLLFLVAPPEVHEQAEALLSNAEGGAHVMRGCLLRRVNLNWGATAAAAAPAPTAAAAEVPAASTSRSSSGSGKESTAVAGSREAAAASTSATASTSSSSSSSSSGGVGTILLNQLEKAGFRGDRLSVWALQGLHNQGLTTPQLQELLAEVTNAAAFHSLLVGEIPGPITKRQAENILADVGLLGSVVDHAAADGGVYGRWPGVGQQESTATTTSSSSSSSGVSPTGQQPDHRDSPNASSSSRNVTSDRSSLEEAAGRWMFTAQQLRLSLQQMGIYEDHVAAAEAADEDFFGHFS